MEISSEDMIDIAMRAGTVVLESGGETYRTEAAVDNVALALGAETASSFVTPTVIQFSYTDAAGQYHTAIRRIKHRVTNLRRVALIDALIRRIQKKEDSLDPGTIEASLSEIERASSYSTLLILLMSAASSFFFSFLFDGTLREAVTAFFIGLLLRGFLELFSRAAPGVFFSSLFSGAFVSILTETAFLTGLIPSTENVLISVLMQVVPGLAIVNAIRDIIEGDLVSGNARLVEAFMIAAGLSVGSVLGLVVFSWFENDAAFAASQAALLQATGAVKPDSAVQATGAAAVAAASSGSLAFLAMAFLWGALSTCSSAVVLDTDIRDILFGSIVGGIGWFVFKLTGGNGASSYLVGACVVAVLCEAGDVIFNRPATVFLIPGLLPLVPGGGMFRTMRAAVKGLSDEAFSLGYSTLAAACAIALGIALVGSIRRMLQKAVKS